MLLRIFTVPAQVTTNPYLTLLYDAIRKENPTCVVQPLSWQKLCHALLHREKVVIHIHWETNIYGSRFVVVSLVRGSLRFLGLVLARLCGARIVWTKHNIFSHDYLHPSIDALGRFIMWSIANVVIVQNRSIATMYQKQYPHVQVVYIPHGNYIGVYGEPFSDSRDALRASFGFTKKETVLLALGLVRPYKNYEQLIDAVVHNAQQGSPVKLWITGKGEPSYIETLRQRAQNSHAVVFYAGYVKDKDMPHVLAAADYSIFAYGESSLTSGAMMLALSYGLPVIVGDMPAAELVENGKNGYRLDASAEVKTELAHVSELPILDKEHVIGSVSQCGWDEVARQTIAVYKAST